jgi:transaldolase
VDTAEVNKIKDLIGFGLLDRTTTNPSLGAKSGRDFEEVAAETCTLTNAQV